MTATGMDHFQTGSYRTLTTRASKFATCRAPALQLPRASRRSLANEPHIVLHHSLLAKRKRIRSFLGSTEGGGMGPGEGVGQVCHSEFPKYLLFS